MIIIGLTGSIAMGKSTAANMLRDMGLPVFDADAAVHKLIGPHGGGVAAVGATFPGVVDRETNAIDREELRTALGSEERCWKLLESVLHPLVQEEKQKFIAQHAAARTPVVVLDIPLLFETGGEKDVDYTICVTAPAFIQRHRALSREDLNEDAFEFRLSRQMPDEEKRKRADFVVQTGLGLFYTRHHLKKIVDGLRVPQPQKNHNNGAPRCGR